MGNLIKTGKSTSIDLSEYLKLNGEYNGGLTFKQDAYTFLSLSLDAISLSKDLVFNNEHHNLETTLNTTSISTIIRKNTNVYVNPFSLTFSGEDNNFYLCSYSVPSMKIVSQIYITTTGKITAEDFTKNPSKGKLDLLQGKLNDKLIATESILLQVPIVATTINNATLTTLSLGSPTLLKGVGSAGDYVSVTSNAIVKILSNTAKTIKISGIFLGDFASGTGTDREFEFQIARPSTPFDVVHKINKVKLTATTVADVEYSFKTSFTAGEEDPFYTDGFILRINNTSGVNISGLTTRAGVTTISSLRIEILS